MLWDIPNLASEIVRKLQSAGTPADLIDAHRAYHTAALREFSTQYAKRFPAASLLGMGGSGVVIKLEGFPSATNAIDSETPPLPKCLKYPHPCVGLPGTFSLIEVIDNEAARLKEINHPHIMPLEETVRVKLSDEDIGERDREVPAYLMPFIESSELLDYISNSVSGVDEVIVLLSQISEALSYLHNQEQVHLDVKPANILVTVDSGNVRALLSDFGFCKHIVAGSQDRTLVMGTDGYMDPDLLRLMEAPTSTNENRVRDRVKRRDLDTQFDRYAFGATILDCIIAFLEPRQSDGNYRTIPTNIFRGLLFIALRCSGRNPVAMRVHAKFTQRRRLAPEPLFRPEIADAFRYARTDELKDDMKRLPGNRLAFLEAEIAETTGDSVCLPERMFAPLSTRVVKTLDSVVIRRLATISQLALCYHVYPGASHTRKEHVLGTYRTTCRLLRQLILDPANPFGAMILKSKQQRLAMVAGLLHDMAHIPLMHEFEDSIPEMSQRSFTSELLAGEWGGENYASSLATLLAEWDIPLDDLRLVLGSRDKMPSRFKGETTQREAKERWEHEWDRPDIQLVRTVVDGAVDADKIDYLQRDALHAGVPFGHGVDHERIETQVTTIVQSSGSGRTLGARCRMGTWRKGQAASESLIGVRHSMYSQVYAHRTVRAARAMLNYVVWKFRTLGRLAGKEGEYVARSLFAFASALGPHKNQPAFLEDKLELMEAVELKISDNLPYADCRVIRWMAFMSGDPLAVEMAEALIARRLYKKVCSLGRDEAEPFMREAFPRKGNVHTPKLTADEWLALTNHLTLQLKGFLDDDSTSIALPLTSTELPPLLLDVAIPKTMRTQTELTIVQDTLASEITWKRVLKLEAERTGVVPGVTVDRSRIYDAYGGGSDDLDPVSIRLFARADLAPNLRPIVDSSTVGTWLERFRPDREK